LTCSTYPLETTVQVQGTFTLADGVTPADPTTVILTVQSPDGVQVEYTAPQVIRVSAGIYQYTIDANQAGPWIYNWQGSGTVHASSGDVYFNVAQSALIS